LNVHGASNVSHRLAGDFVDIILGMTERRGDSSSISERLTDRISIGVLIRTVPRELVDEVLAETGRREKRSRRLPAHVVVYFVIAMTVFRDGYEEVLRKLVNGLSFLGNWRDTWTVPTAGAISQARERLEELPMRTLFDRITVPLAKPGTRGAWLRAWRLMAIDGVQIDVPDSVANMKEFGKYEGGTRRPFPGGSCGRSG
jgi:hypothetical protein